VKCNLDEAEIAAATMCKANLSAVDLRGAKLAFAKTDSTTKLKDSGLERVRSEPAKGRGGRE
jgi:uncharacterized protein YjbI with pentapeptide repeats